MLNALLALKGLDPPFFRTIVAPFFSCSEPSGWKPPASGGTPSSRRAVSLARRTAVCVLSLSHGPSVRVGASLSAKFYLLAEPVPRRWAEHNNRRDDGDILQSARPTSWKYSAAESNESQMRSSHSCRLFILQRRLFSFLETTDFTVGGALFVHFVDLSASTKEGDLLASLRGEGNWRSALLFFFHGRGQSFFILALTIRLVRAGDKVRRAEMFTESSLPSTFAAFNFSGDIIGRNITAADVTLSLLASVAPWRYTGELTRALTFFVCVWGGPAKGSFSLSLAGWEGCG